MTNTPEARCEVLGRKSSLFDSLCVCSLWRKRERETENWVLRTLRTFSSSKKRSLIREVFFIRILK